MSTLRMPVSEEFLGRLRRAVGRNVADFAHRIEFPVTTVHNYLKGTKPNVAFFEALTTRTNIDVMWLLTGEGDMTRIGSRQVKFFEDPAAVALVEDDDLRELFEWALVSPEVKGALLYIKEREIRPIAQKFITDLKRNASKAG